MNYQDFLEYKEKILVENKEIINLAENNLYVHHVNDIAYDNSGHINGIVYRCHLVEDWLRYHGLPEEFKPMVGVSSGVRESLSILAKEFKDKTFIIPQDVYPFYQKTLNDNNINFKEYKTLSSNESDAFDFKDKEADILLITDPIKPLGLDLSIKFYNDVKEWLSKDKDRLLIVDAVYLLGNEINKELLKLFLETQQVILLFSLSKSWCLPNHFGVTLFPQKLLHLREGYKLLEKKQEKLNIAYMVLNNKSDFNKKLKEELKNKQNTLEKLLGITIANSNNPGYLFYINKNFNELLSQNILSIPVSVFGGNDNGVVVSSLGL